MECHVTTGEIRDGAAFQRKPGRPLEMAPDDVLDRIRRLAADASGLFRVHQTQPALYARARRLFGSWPTAVGRAGIDYDRVLRDARDSALRSRRRRFENARARARAPREG